MIMDFPKTYGFDCNNPDCSITCFTAKADQISVKWVRDRGVDQIELQAHCPCCETMSWRYYGKPDKFRSVFNMMLEDMFKDVDPNLPEGV